MSTRELVIRAMDAAGPLRPSGYRNMIEAAFSDRREQMDELERELSAEPRVKRAPATRRSVPGDYTHGQLVVVTADEVLLHLTTVGEAMTGTRIIKELAAERGKPIDGSSVSKALKELLWRDEVVVNGSRKGKTYLAAPRRAQDAPVNEEEEGNGRVAHPG